MYNQDYSDDEIEQTYERKIEGHIGEVLVNYTTQSSRAIIYRGDDVDTGQRLETVPFEGLGSAARDYVNQRLDALEEKSS